MAGNEVAKLLTVIKCDTGDIDKKLKLIKGGLQETDAKLVNFKTAVAQSEKALKSAKIALEAHNAQMKFQGTASEGMKAKQALLNMEYQKAKVVLTDNKLALNKYQGELTKAETNTSLLSKATAGLKANLGMILAGVGIAVGAGLVALGKKAIDTAGDFEQLGVSFEVLAGGKQVGDNLLNSLVDLANVTPMTTKGLADNARLLLSFGEAVQNIEPDLRMLGDISGGNQERMNSLTLAFAQCGASGRLMGQDLLQMVNAGFNPLQIMSDKTGKSVGVLKKEMEEGKISFSMVKQAMREATEEGGRFYGMMEKQSQTLQGRLSTLADKWGQVAKGIGDFFLPVAKLAVDILIKLGDAVLSLQKKMDNFSQDFAGNTVKSQENLAKGLKKQSYELFKLAKEYEKRGNADWAKTYKKKAQEYLKSSEEAIKKAKEIEKKHSLSVGGGNVSTGFKDSIGDDKKKKSKKSKSYETVLNERASLIKAQSDYEIATNNYTDAQVLQKKIDLQKRLVALYSGTSTKTKTDKIQSLTELANLENQLEDQRISNKISKLEQERAMEKVQNEMNLNAQLMNVQLTEKQKTEITNNAKKAELQVEITLQRQILDIRRKGVENWQNLQAKDKEIYLDQALKKLEAEKTFQDKLRSEQGVILEENAQIASSMANNFTSSFRSIIDGTESVSGAFKNMFSNIAMNLVQSGIENILSRLFIGAVTGGGTGGSLISSATKLFKQHGNGGYPDTSRPFIAGERGAELVVPTNKTKVFTNKETQGIFGGSGEQGAGQTIQPIIVSNTFKVETMNGDNAVKTLLKPESKAAIVKMMGDALDYNQGGFRNKVKNV